MTPTFDIRGTGHPQAQLSVNGLNAVINTPRARHSVGDRKDEFAQDLPGYAARQPYLVDDYPACPNNWVRSSATMKSYFVPVTTGNELWLDFNGNNKHPYHLAVVVSVQGINAVTGLPCQDAQLEQYIKECPKHKEDFGPDRYCKSCGYHWPKQNYICTTGTPHGCLWLDGFRAAEGVIRQFLLTEDKMRSVAGGLIGENRVFAFGISFFLSRSPRPQQVVADSGWQDRSSGQGGRGGTGAHVGYIGNAYILNGIQSIRNVDRIHGPISTSAQFFNPQSTSKAVDITVIARRGAVPDMTLACDHSFQLGTVNSLDAEAFASQLSAAAATPIEPKKLEIAAGARIDQVIYPDPSPLDFWRDQPEGILVINYIAEKDCLRILAGGEVKQPVHAEGFLQAVPVGN